VRPSPRRTVWHPCTTQACNLQWLPAVLQAVYLKPNVGVFSTNGVTIVGHGAGSPGEGFVLRPGKYARPLNFGTLWFFSSFGIKIQVGGRLEISLVKRWPGCQLWAAAPSPPEPRLPTWAMTALWEQA
jgi:hypothetical protein